MKEGHLPSFDDNKEKEMNGYWSPFNDGYGIVGWNWNCNCGRYEFLPLDDYVCPCGLEMPDIDQDEWYDKEMEKPVNFRAWNLKKV